MLISSRIHGISMESHGSIVLLRPLRGDVERQLRNLTPRDGQWHGDALGVEPRSAVEIIDAVGRGEGLE